MVMDAVSPMARELLPRLLAVVPREAQTRAPIALLEAWDGTMRRDRPEPLIFTAWMREIARALYADETGALFRQLWDVRPALVARALTTRPEWCDDVATPARETCAEAVGLALARALDGLAAEHGADPAGWRWGDAHVARFAHPVFGFVPIVRPLANIVIPVDGGAYTVNRAQYDIASDRTPFAAVHGPGYRAVYDLADLDRSLFTQATGESGNPLSRHYRDLTTRWRDGEFIRIAGGAAAREGAVGILRLAPRPAPGKGQGP
jgi:penicillin amidase